MMIIYDIIGILMYVITRAVLLQLVENTEVHFGRKTEMKIKI